VGKHKLVWIGMAVILLGGAVIWPISAGARRTVRPACGAFCRQAAGIGGGGAVQPPKFLHSLQGTVVVRGGIAPIGVRCVRNQPCRGALVLAPSDRNAQVGGNGDLGRVDLNVPSGTAETIEVTLNGNGISYLRSHSPLTVDVRVYFAGSNQHDDLLMTLVYLPATGTSAAAGATGQPNRVPSSAASAASVTSGSASAGPSPQPPPHSTPGCGKFCQSAGGFGSGPGPGPPPRLSLLDNQLSLSNRQVSLPLRCLVSQACRGALILLADIRGKGGPSYTEVGRSDLFVPGHSTLIVDFTLTPHGAALVRAHHRVKGSLTALIEGKSPRDLQLQNFDVTISARRYGQARATTRASTTRTPATIATPIRQSGGRRMIVRAAPQSRHHS
jgi:hypothetical protein